VPIYAGDDEATLIERTKRAEHRLYPEVLTWIAQGRLVLTPDAVFQNGAKLEEPILMDERN
jgi:Folate-dependent phosphoribosylglycinamide formyltransferase PurN